MCSRLWLVFESHKPIILGGCARLNNGCRHYSCMTTPLSNVQSTSLECYDRHSQRYQKVRCLHRCFCFLFLLFFLLFFFRFLESTHVTPPPLPDGPPSSFSLIVTSSSISSLHRTCSCLCHYRCRCRIIAASRVPLTPLS